MTHPAVQQLRFARSEFMRGIGGLSDEDARKRVMPMNCISWNIGHLAWQEQRYWLHRARGQMLLPDINTTYAYGAAASTPPLSDVLDAWRTITAASDPWLDQVTQDGLLEEPVKGVTFGNLVLRTTYHYWYHTGENAAIRQSLGHTGLPDFVGDIDSEAPYRPE